MKFDVYLAKNATPEQLRQAQMLFGGEAEGAPFRIGDRVVKVNSEPGDSFPDGTEGTVVASAAGDLKGSFYFYYVFFDPLPIPAVLIMGRRLRAAESSQSPTSD